MEFFGMGPLEILLVLIVALIFIGPGKLPQLARNLGKGVRAFKKATFDLTSEMSKELEEEEKQKKQSTGQAENNINRTGAAAGDKAGNSRGSGDLQ